MNLVRLPVRKMFKTLLTNAALPGAAAEQSIRKRDAVRDQSRPARKRRHTNRDFLCTALLALILVPSAAAAEPLVTLPAPPFELPVLPPVSGTWTVMVGVGGEYKPDFEGAKRSMLSPIPIFSIRHAGSTDQFRGPRDSASIALIDFGDLRAGPAGKFVTSRKANSYSELNGLGDVKTTVELGGLADYSADDGFRPVGDRGRGCARHRVA